MNNEIKWGTKIEVFDLEGYHVTTGYFLECKGGNYWVSSLGEEYAFDVAEFNISKVHRKVIEDER